MPRKPKDTFDYNKPWYTFLSKLNKFNDLPVDEWNEYQLLGYLLSRTEIKINPVVKDPHYGYVDMTAPSKHPFVRIVRQIMKRHADANETKQFLDYCLSTTTKAITRLDIFRKVERYTPVPASVNKLFNKVTTYGDLALYVQMEPESLLLLSDEMKDIIKRIA